VKNKTLAALMMLALAGGILLAQPSEPAAPKPAKMPELTAEQQQKMDALRTAHLKEMLPLRTELEVKQIELDALWRADEPEAKKIVAKVKEIGDLRQKMEIARINHQFEARKVLTPEQRKLMGRMGMGPRMMDRARGRGMKHCPTGGRRNRGAGDGPPAPMMGGCPPQGCGGCKMH